MRKRRDTQSALQRQDSVDSIGGGEMPQQAQQEQSPLGNGSPLNPISPRPTGITHTSVCGSPVSPALDRWIRQRSRDLTLRRVDTQRAAKFVNHLRDELLEFLRNNQERPYFRQARVLNSGSYFEMVKINSPNEFDMMLILPTPRLEWAELEECPGVFYTVAVLRRPRTHEIRSYLLEDQLIVSAARVRAHMRELVCKFMSTYEVPYEDSCWVVCEEDEGSPAVTLELWRQGSAEAELSVDVVPTLEVCSQAWPAAARAGPKMENWLGKNARRKLTSQDFYFVPKMPKGSDVSDLAKESWRISFSHIEKEIIRNHGNRRTCCEGRANRCCRKLCLRLLKRLIKGLKQRFPEELEPLCSYHGKTMFFHALAQRGDDSQWNVGDLSACFLFLLRAFEGYAQSGHLPHFFVPSHNLFASSAFPQSTLDFLVAKLREQRELNLPLLQSTPPMPSLGPPQSPPPMPSLGPPQSPPPMPSLGPPQSLPPMPSLGPPMPSLGPPQHQSLVAHLSLGASPQVIQTVGAAAPPHSSQLKVALLPEHLRGDSFVAGAVMGALMLLLCLSLFVVLG